jgi:hypothetical protein
MKINTTNTTKRSIKATTNGFRKGDKIARCNCCERRYRIDDSYEGLCPQCDVATGISLSLCDFAYDTEAEARADFALAFDALAEARTLGGNIERVAKEARELAENLVSCVKCLNKI